MILDTSAVIAILFGEAEADEFSKRIIAAPICRISVANPVELAIVGRHPAQLNFGDCFAYALAKTLDEPLLFQGDDFAHTDVRSARDL